MSFLSIQNFIFTRGKWGEGLPSLCLHSFRGNGRWTLDLLCRHIWKILFIIVVCFSNWNMNEVPCERCGGRENWRWMLITCENIERERRGNEWVDRPRPTDITRRFTIALRLGRCLSLDRVSSSNPLGFSLQETRRAPLSFSSLIGRLLLHSSSVLLICTDRQRRPLSRSSLQF